MLQLNVSIVPRLFSIHPLTGLLLSFGDQITSGQLYVRADDTMRLDMSDRINMNITATNGCNVFTHKRRILKGAICKKKVDF